MNENVDNPSIVSEDDVDLNETSNNLWDQLGDDLNNYSTMIWHVDYSFDVGDKGRFRDVFASINRERAIGHIVNTLMSPDVLENCNYDPRNYDTPLEAMKAFFENQPGRNLFIALLPVI